MSPIKQNISRRLAYPALLLVCSLALLPADQAHARKIYNEIQGPTADQCRVCHEDLNTFPQLMFINPDRHHLRVNKAIMGLGGGTHPTMAPGDTSTGTYTCLSCHEISTDPLTGDFNLIPFRDCLGCHIKSSVTTSPGSGQNVHHFTQTFYQGRCKECHESPLAEFNKSLSDKVAGSVDYSQLLDYSNCKKCPSQ